MSSQGYLYSNPVTFICETVVCGRNVSQLRNRHKSKKWIHKCRLHIHINYICFQISKIYLQISKIYLQMPVYLYTFYHLFVCRVFVFVFCVWIFINVFIFIYIFFIYINLYETNLSPKVSPNQLCLKVSTAFRMSRNPRSFEIS